MRVAGRAGQEQPPSDATFPRLAGTDPATRLPLPLHVDAVGIRLDGSAFASQALPLARELASRLSVPLTMIGRPAPTAVPAMAFERGWRRRASVAQDFAAKGDDTSDLGMTPPADPMTEPPSTGTLWCTSSYATGWFAPRSSQPHLVLEHNGAPFVVVGPSVYTPYHDSTSLAVPPGARLTVCAESSQDLDALVPLATAWAASLGLELEFLMTRARSTASLRAPADLLDRRAPFPATVDVHDLLGGAAAIAAHVQQRPTAFVMVMTRAGGRRRWPHRRLSDRIVRMSPVPVMLVPPVRSI